MDRLGAKNVSFTANKTLKQGVKIMSNTTEQFKAVIEECRHIFVTKMRDYGSAWRILRTTSLTDQIYIKANRIRTIQLKGTSRVDEGVRPEFIGIINYCIMAVIQLREGADEELNMPIDKAAEFYNTVAEDSRNLMDNKNHDYGEAWRSMRISSMTDLILMKLLRVKQIEDNDGKTLISEGLEANYLDMLNYAVFAMILLNEESS